jgi:hypothetical protein
MAQEYRVDVGARSFKGYPVGTQASEFFSSQVLPSLPADQLIVVVKDRMSVENVHHWEIAARAATIQRFFYVVAYQSDRIGLVLTSPFRMSPLWNVDFAFKQVEGASLPRLASEILHYDVLRHEFSILHGIAEVDVMRMVEMGLVLECHTVGGALYDFSEGVDARLAVQALAAARRVAGSALDPGNERLDVQYMEMTGEMPQPTIEMAAPTAIDHSRVPDYVHAVHNIRSKVLGKHK